MHTLNNFYLHFYLRGFTSNGIDESPNLTTKESIGFFSLTLEGVKEDQLYLLFVCNKGYYFVFALR